MIYRLCESLSLLWGHVFHAQIAYFYQKKTEYIQGLKKLFELASDNFNLLVLPFAQDIGQVL
jgi:hypothetical protein